MLPDEQLDALLRDAKPRAPKGFEGRVVSRVRRPQWGWMVAGVAAIVVVATAVTTLSMRPKAPMPIGGYPAFPDPWFVAGQIAARVDGPAELSRLQSTVSLSAGGSIDVLGEDLQLRGGNAMLNGEAILLGTTSASVITRTPDAQVEVAMNARKVGATVAVAATAAVVSIHVLRGTAEIMPITGEAAGQPVFLAQGDRALVTARRPPAILRASHTQGAAAAQGRPGAASVQRQSEKPVAIQAPPSPAPGAEPVALDKEVIRQGIRSMIPRVRECYEQGLARNPKLAGKIVVRFVIRTKDGRGRIDEAEMDPENDELQSPLVEQCILNAIVEIDFPATYAGSEVHVSYPFVLESGTESTPRR